jgi:hypothetical protein
LYDLNQEQAVALLESGYDVVNVDIRRGFVDVMLDRDHVEQAALLSPRYDLMPEEWGYLLPENSRNAGYYYSPEENWAFWCGLAASHSDLVDTPMTIGQSFEGRDIYAIRITSSSGPSYKPVMYFSSLIHAREPGGNSVLIDFATWLTTNYSSDTMAEWILDNTQVWFLPVANPDGYEYNMPGGGYHRKNMNWSVPVPSDGIDLNRNWGYQWGYDDYGSSPDPYDATYRGSAPFSEDENQVQRDFINSLAPIAGMNYHTYGAYLLYPWGYNNSPTPDQSTFEAWGAAMTQYNNYEYGRAGQLLYNVNGEQNDWCYYDGDGHPKMMAFTPEVGDNGFWGGQNDTTLIEEFCLDCRYMNIWLCMNAPGFVGVEDEEHEGVPPVAMSIEGVWPNPVTASGILGIEVSVPEAAQFRGALYDISGHLVADLFRTGIDAGESVLTATVPESVPSGLYLLRGSAGRLEDTAMVTVVR